MLTLQDIRDLELCYDPTKHLPDDWRGELHELLDVTACPAIDRIWVVLMLMPTAVAIEFAQWCAADAADDADAARAAARAAGWAADAARAADAADAAARERQLVQLRQITTPPSQA